MCGSIPGQAVGSRECPRGFPAVPRLWRPPLGHTLILAPRYAQWVSLGSGRHTYHDDANVLGRKEDFLKLDDMRMPQHPVVEYLRLHILIDALAAL